MTKEVEIKGSVEDIIFHNNENGYSVFSVLDDEEETICVGVVPHLLKGESIKVFGSWVVHPTYGKQLQIDYFEKFIPTTEDGIEKYLASGVVKGLGAKTAKKIVKKFKEDTFYIIEEKPDRLIEIKGINYEKAMLINKVFVEQKELRQVMLFLQNYGISPTYSMKIFKKYKGRTFTIVKENPYRIADDIFGIGFKMADRLAYNSGIALDSPNRIKSGIKYVLNQNALNGNVYFPKDILLKSASELLNVEPLVVDACVKELQIENQLWQEVIDGKEAVFLNLYYYSELAVAKKLIEISMDYSKDELNNINLKIEKAEKKSCIKLAEKQKEAVKEAMANGLLIITGGPGTGKTTTINTIINILLEDGNDVVLAAPTGRAAKRMTEATGMEAQTIHRLLGINFIGEDNRQQTFEKNEDDPIDADVIIIDESSMVDILLMNSLLKAISLGTRLILVGDVDQLPSVGPGNVLKDIIQSEKLKVVKLDEIFRQAQESAIIMNAHRINKGIEPVLNDKNSDFFFIKRANVEDVVKTIKDLVIKRIPSFLECDPIQSIQVLTPMRKSPVGVQNLNAVLQETLNPKDDFKNEKLSRNILFREGDKVMQIKNNYNLVWKMYGSYGKVSDEGIGVFNGDEGVISAISDSKETMTVIFDDGKTVEYDYTQIDELDLAYAITIHKSQGSEYPVVIIPIHSGPEMLMSRNLLYTAVTRAKQLVVIVGLSEMIKKMVENNREVNRFTNLSKKILDLYEFMNDNEA